jgi:hypothetical protein
VGHGGQACAFVLLTDSVFFAGRALSLNGPLAICAICVPVFVLFSRVRIIGLTGGIASGKSETSRVFRQMGVPVIDADEIAHAVMEKGKPSHGRVVSAFRKYPGVVTADGDIDRGALRELVFSDPDLNRCLARVYVCKTFPYDASAGEGSRGGWSLMSGRK